MTDLKKELEDLDRKIGRAYREYKTFSGAVSQTEGERHLWPKKTGEILKEIDALELKRLALIDQLEAPKEG